MDNKIKIVIVVLIVLAVLFFSGMAGNLIPKQRDGTSNQKEYQQGGGGWETTLGEWMSPFAPSLEVKKLLENNKNECESTLYKFKYRAILLNKTKDSCVIDIPELKDEKYSKGKLSLLEEGTKIPDVKVLYLPKGESDEPDPEPVSLTVKESISFVVLAKGGTLTIECSGCFDDQNRTIRVIFE